MLQKSEHKVGHHMNHNKNFHLASIFGCSGHTASFHIFDMSFVIAIFTISGLICSHLLLIDFE